MRKTVTSLAVLLGAALFLGGCATTRGDKFGYFVPPSAAAPDADKLVADAVRQLAVLHPPALTRLDLQQPTPDAFGKALVAALRDKGYGVSEYAPGGTAAPAGLALRYVLDQADESGLYRLTLVVGNQSLSRPYLASNGVFAPAGYWVRQE